MWPVVTDGVVWSVCHTREPCQNGGTNRYVVWVVDLGGSKEACVWWWCTLAPPGGYNWIVHVQRWCGLMSNYLDHLLENVAAVAWYKCMLLFLHFTWVIDDAKCIVVTAICVSVCLSVGLSIATFPHYCTDPDVTWGYGRGCRLVMHYWADLQSVHRYRYYDNIDICKLITA